MKEKKEAPSPLKPRLLFFVTLGAVFVAELLVMFLLEFSPPLPPVAEAFLDACLLSILAGPVLYFLFLKPLLGNIEKQKQAEIEREKIQEMDRLKSEFISVAAHELNTPLTLIMGYSEVLASKNSFDNECLREFATKIHQKAETMERLINDLMDLGRMEIGQTLRIRRKKEDIVSTVLLLVNDYKQTYPDRCFRVNLPQPPVYFPFDKVRIEQALANVLNNAMKFSPQDSSIEIEGARENGEFIVRIRDHGIGMSQEDLEHVFDKYYRAEVSDYSAPGLGLGMTIVKEIIVSHGGEIRLESIPQAGTTVIITLPVVDQ